MVVILRAFPVAVEDLATPLRLPSVDELRPSSCPVCAEPARPPGKRLGIVGHGTYRRQVLGWVVATQSLTILVRRFRCRGCGGTIAVLPDALLPRRWYAGSTMLLALVLSLLLGRPAAEVRRRLAQAGETSGWKNLERWQRRVLAPLWGWCSAQLGFADGRPGADRDQRVERVRRLLALKGASARSPDAEIMAAACSLASGTAHTRGESWLIGRAR